MMVGTDLQGVAIHIAARVSALAGAGEVLTSNTVKELVLGSGITFEDRGIHELKGVPDQWRIYAVLSDTTPATSERELLRPPI